MIGQILSTMLPVFLIAGCGALYGRYRTPDIKGLNVLNMELFVPMLVFAVLADQKAPLQDYAQLALAATVVVLGSGIVLYPLAKVLKLNLKTFLPPMMFNNSGNMGIPILVLAFGDAALPAAVVMASDIDRFSALAARPTTARITPKPVPAMPKPTSTS